MAAEPTEQLSFRRASEDDVPFLVELRRRTMTAHETASGIDATDDQRVSRVRARFDCAEMILSAGQPVGLLKLVRDSEGWELLQLQIVPEKQRAGWGTSILARVIDEARQAGAPITLRVLKANPARRLYERFGFIVAKEDAHAYTMRLDLAQRFPAGRIAIVPCDLDDPRVRALLHEHLAAARATSPPESVHALDLDGLKAPSVSVWAAWDGNALLGVGALQQLAPDHGEVKSMHTARSHRRKGVGSAILLHIVAAARARGMSRLSLETGSPDYFSPARELYKRHGFAECPPFADYVVDPYSVFMSRDL